MANYDYLIVGSGLFGATFAYLARQKGRRCLVIDRRPQLGGNVYCEQTEGINVHKYGAHIFHTSNRKVWNFVNRFADFNRYTNSPLANYQGRLYNLPFNMNTFCQMWGVRTPQEALEKLEEQRAEARKSIGGEPRNLEEQALFLVGREIYERLIKGYTEKQWGRKCTELPPFIIRRLPIRLVFDNNYFNDAYQGIPIGGYNKLVEALLEGVETHVSTDYFEHPELRNVAKKTVFSGQIDRFFDFRLGHLDYRSLRFETETLECANFQGNAVVNYTEASVPFTRIIEHKHFETFGDEVNNGKTVISREYPAEWSDGMEPYYPVNDERNNRLAEQYRTLAEQEPDVIFGGRLAEYRYYDMAPVIERVLGMAENV